MAKWIWNNLNVSKDDYSIFKSSFFSNDKKVTLKISADTDYMVYINNKLVAFGQYPCFPYNPVYDLIDLKCKQGINEVKILVYYCGDDSLSTYYYCNQPGLYFEFIQNGKVVLESNEDILSTRYLAFEHGHAEKITPQLGYRVFYNATKDKRNYDFDKSIIVSKSLDFEPRGNLKTKLYPHLEGKVLKNEKGHLLIDFEKESTGYLDLDFISSKKQKLLICWGEHIVDGGVRYIIGNRNFSTEFIAKKGRNKFFSTFRRYGLRYLEVFYKEEIEINKFGIKPVYYPFKERKYKLDNPLRQKIYDTAVHTLKCCYHDHFEDCPWREQAFYPMDSRNQILFHQYAFKNKESIRSALKLISQDKREDNILCITIPANFPLTITSYSLYYFEECYRYASFFKDDSLLVEVYPKLTSIINAYLSKVENGLLQNFIGENYWNFYEWVPGLEDFPRKNAKYDIVLNSLFIIALKYMDLINKRLNKPMVYQTIISKIKKACRKEFYDKDTGLFHLSNIDSKYYCLANSFACLAGIATKKEISFIADQLVNNKKIIKSSIASRIFMYDVLIGVNKNKYRDFVLNDIDKTCSYQLEHDATTFWETELGEKDFDNAGSLCHAWSAFAIYYYHKLIK